MKWWSTQKEIKSEFKNAWEASWRVLNKLNEIVKWTQQIAKSLNSIVSKFYLLRGCRCCCELLKLSFFSSNNFLLLLRFFDSFFAVWLANVVKRRVLVIIQVEAKKKPSSSPQNKQAISVAKRVQLNAISRVLKAIRLSNVDEQRRQSCLDESLQIEHLPLERGEWAGVPAGGPTMRHPMHHRRSDVHDRGPDALAVD